MAATNGTTSLSANGNGQSRVPAQTGRADGLTEIDPKTAFKVIAIVFGLLIVLNAIAECSLVVCRIRPIDPASLLGKLAIGAPLVWAGMRKWRRSLLPLGVTFIVVGVMFSAVCLIEDDKNTIIAFGAFAFVLILCGIVSIVKCPSPSLVQSQPMNGNDATVAPLPPTKVDGVAKQADCIGIRFEIGKLDDGAYGKECWKVFWSAVDPEMVAGTQLLEGDTNETPDHENVYCLAVKWWSGVGRCDDVRKALDQSIHYRKVASTPDFVSATQVSKEPLVEAGKVDMQGQIVGMSYRARPALEYVQNERAQGKAQHNNGAISKAHASPACKCLNSIEAHAKAVDIGMIGDTSGAAVAALELDHKPATTIYVQGEITCVCKKSLPLEVRMDPGWSGGAPSVTCPECRTRMSIIEQVSDQTALIVASIEAVQKQYQSLSIALTLTGCVKKQEEERNGC